MNKIVSYVGFARKANKLLTGQTHLKHTKEKLYLILVCCSATDNLKNLAKNLAEKNGCECIITNIPLEKLTNIEKIKIVALTDENLSKAIINNKEIITVG